MGETNILVYLIVGLLGIAAAALGFAAEGTRIKVSDIRTTEFSCIYPSTSANILGYIAALLTLIAQVTISAVARCGCCQRNTSNTKSPAAIFFFVVSWVASVIGIILLIAAANLSTRQEYLDATGLCYTVKPGVFAAGGGLALVACIFGLWSYSSVTKHHVLSVPVAVPYNQGGIAMGNPQFATASAYTNPKQQQYV
ncbi:protein MODIFYING WALL LIGNIN-2 [Beta vulgaris subsp. vulgaris]|uniref:protein MODIFYING WALL LIGNIN-2 n=1 Tax=Beta vulgaris subsp. vulgaris TaxID=3555 RepID=UPI002036732F|nr:protein MODIFYING WALL LIGNIN-2 [Beta vulgaris subsp. vulgaris]